MFLVRMVVKAMSTSAGPSAGPIHALLTAKLLKAFNPTHLELENESYKHSVPPGRQVRHVAVLYVVGPLTLCDLQRVAL
jgi:stress-induced morphogen